MTDDNKQIDYTLKNATLRIQFGNITEVETDIIVSSDNNHLTMSVGVSSAIVRAAGEHIRDEVQKDIPLTIGDVVITSGGDLSANHIFHAIIIDHDKGLEPSKQSIYMLTRKCLQMADTVGAKKIVFPALATGAIEFSFELAAQAMSQAITEYLRGETGIELVIITLFAGGAVEESDLTLFYDHFVTLLSDSKQTEQVTEQVNEGDEQLAPLIKADAQEIIEDSQAVSPSFQTPEDIPDDIIERNKDLEAKIRHNKLHGLLTELDVQISYQNELRVEKVKHTRVGIRLDMALEEVNNKVAEIEAQIKCLKVDIDR